MRDGVVNRIKQVMDYYQMSASVFSAEIGVQRSSISHILSGRNNPSLDMVQRILEKFTKVNSEWMLFGKGNMFSDKSPVNLFDSVAEITTQVKTDISKQDQTSHKAKELATVTQSDKSEASQSSKSELKVADDSSTAEKDVEKIVFFYKDGSFKVYKPE